MPFADNAAKYFASGGSACARGAQTIAVTATMVASKRVDMSGLYAAVIVTVDEKRMDPVGLRS
ncbi:hypothetical protein ABIA30_003114 [Mycobacterium sp. MAA66]